MMATRGFDARPKQVVIRAGLATTIGDEIRALVGHLSSPPRACRLSPRSRVCRRRCARHSLMKGGRLRIAGDIPTPLLLLMGPDFGILALRRSLRDAMEGVVAGGGILRRQLILL